MEKTNIQLNIMNIVNYYATYSQAVAYLLNKYGAVTDDYYKEKSYTRFLNGEIKSITKGKYTRSSEGLYCHHISRTNSKFI